MNVYQNAPRCQRRDTGGTLMRYGLIARLLHFLSLSTRKGSFLQASSPVCHEPLSLLRVTRSFLSIGLDKMDSVHAHLDFLLVFAAKAALWESQPQHGVFHFQPALSYFQNFNHITFCPLCKYRRKEQECPSLSQTQTLLSPQTSSVIICRLRASHVSSLCCS